MSKIRVLVVDDAVVIRKIVTDALSLDPEIEVCGVAANGKIALQKIPQVNPDIITLDVEMPELDGLGTLKALRKDYPKLPVIMFSTLTERGAETTLDALSLGATDYCTKPANVGSVSEAKKEVSESLIQKIKFLCKRNGNIPVEAQNLSGPVQTKRVASTHSSTIQGLPAQEIVPLRHEPAGLLPKIVCIAVSTGGPNALADLVPRLRADFPVPIVCVQHMPPLFTRMLAERLNSSSAINVVEAESGMSLKPGCMYIAPGDYHMVLVSKTGKIQIELNQEPAENSCRPAADPLFRSVVKHYNSCVLGVVLTGMGQDGLRGAELIKEAGGYVFAQDKQSSVVWGMPGYVTEAGLADQVLPLDQMAAQIEHCTRNGLASRQQKIH